MLMKVGLFSVFSLIILMIIPAYADVGIATIIEETFTVDEKFTISGTNDDGEGVIIVAVIRGPAGEKYPLKNTIASLGIFKFIPIDAGLIFSSKGTYTINVFTESQPFGSGPIIKIEYDGKVATLLPDYVLKLKAIGNKNVDETKNLSFTASVTDSSISLLEYSLVNSPSGAEINKDTGKFSWTPTGVQAGGYIFSIVVKSGPLEDRETITVTVSDSPESEQTTPEPTEPEPTITEPDELEIPAPFVDESKDPQHYVDRYNNEIRYKEWFDATYPEYSSIQEAVGLEAPKELAPFVDKSKDPQHYVDRYNNEITYKEWFDKTYPEITIYEAVGLEEPIIEEPEFGECGEGTKLIDGKCTVVATESKGGGCLIATAAYGSEMAPQVQLLREIRDNQLMNTDSGVSFMTGFNQLYYSFSPTIADMQRENPVFKEAVKIGITPLLSSLSIMSHAESESQVMGYGIGVILMNVGMYFVAPVMLFYGIRKVRRVRF